MWIDTHCHLDAAEFDADRADVVARARTAGVTRLVLPAVAASNFNTVRDLVRHHGGPAGSSSGWGYALGIHPLFVAQAAQTDLDQLESQLAAHRDDPALVAVGEIGLDFFVPGLDRERQAQFYQAQLQLAKQFDLPVIVHVRRSADAVLAPLRRVGGLRGIAHAFNGSLQQAQAFIDLGFKLGFGGAMTHERALRIRELAATVPEHGIVLETDAPDIPPQWLYLTAAQRAAGQHSRNQPAELPRIAETLAQLRGWTLAHTAEVTRANACAALPRLERS